MQSPLPCFRTPSWCGLILVIVLASSRAAIPQPTLNGTPTIPASQATVRQQSDPAGEDRLTLLAAAPTLQVILPLGSSPTSDDVLLYGVVFSQVVDNVDPTDFVVTGTTATVTEVTTGDGQSYNVTVSGGNLPTMTGSVTLGLAETQNISAGGTALENLTPTAVNESTYQVQNNRVPEFVGSETSVTVGQGSAATDVAPLLHVSDPDLGQTLTWTCEWGPNFGTLLSDGVIGGAMTATSGGTDIAPGVTVTYQPNPGFAGIDTFQIVVDDGSGAAPVARQIEVRVIPARLSAPILNADSDSGTSQTDGITNVTSLTFTGNGVTVGHTVTVFLDRNGDGDYDLGTDPSALTGTADGSWSAVIDVAGIPDGSYDVYAFAEVSPLIGPLSLKRTVTLDRTTPTNRVLSAQFSADNGWSGTDFITNVSAQTVSGTLRDPLGANDLVDVSVNGGSVWAIASAEVGSQNWSIANRVLQGPPRNGLRVRLTDVAGNTAGDSTLYFVDYMLDTSVPTVGITRQSPASTATNSSIVTFRAAFSESVAGVSAASFSLGCGGSVTASIRSVTGAGSTYSVLVDAAGEGALQVDLRPSGNGITDRAGNVPNGYSSGQSYTLDHVAPAAPVITGFTSDTGISATDGMTTDTTPTFSGTAETGSTVRLTRVGTGPIGSPAVASGGTWSVSCSTALPAGSHTFTATATDPADNTSATSAERAVTIDTAAPTVVGVTSSSADGSYKVGEVIPVSVKFVEVVAVTGVPQLTLETGATDRVANYSSGSGTDTLTFLYTVQAGDVSMDLNYVATSSLALNGGTIVDIVGNSAPRMLPALTDANSLSGSKNLVIDGVAPTVLAIGRQSPAGASTDASSVTYHVTFSEQVSGVDAADFTLTETGVAGGVVASVTAINGTVYDVVVNALSSPGTLRLDLKDAGTGIADAAGNAIATGFTGGETYTLIAPEEPPAKQDQTIAFGPLADKPTTDQSFKLNATASSGMAVKFTVISGPATISGDVVTLTGMPGVVTFRATQSGNDEYEEASPVERSFRVVAAPPTPVVPPVSGGAITLSAGGPVAGCAYQWRCNGSSVSGGNGAMLRLENVQPANAGLYAYTMTTPDGKPSASAPVIVGVSTTLKLEGLAEEVLTDVRHPNGNVYDQLLLEGSGASFTADPGQVTRMSFVDLSDDIVQVEFSGAGTLSLVMDNASAAAPAANYNQPGVNYVRGNVGIVITGANETSNVSVFSVGRANAVNQSLFRDGVAYDGVANVAFIAIQSTNGRFGGVYAGNVEYFASQGFTGLYAPGVAFAGPVNIGDIQAYDSAQPVLVVGSASNVRIAGGTLAQPNGRPIHVDGLTHLTMAPGQTSQGNPLPAQPNQGVLQQHGVDVTELIVAGR